MISGWPWILLNLYLVISLCAVLFDLWVMLSANSRQRARLRQEERLKTLLDGQLERLRRGQSPDETIQRELFQRLRAVDGALAFSDLIDPLSQREEPGFAQWVAASGPLFVRLCGRYGRRQNMYRASFAWLLACCWQDIPAAKPFLLSCVTSRGSIYCRENALTALYRGGNAKMVVQAFKRMSQADIHHSQKLLADGLLSFRGDREELCALLWREFQTLTPSIRLALVDFMRLLGSDYRQDLLPLLDDPATDDELCFAILRYFGRCTCPPARERMTGFLAHPRNALWEYAAVSASTLRGYPCAETKEALLRALNHPNWYVRYNAAESLVAMGLPEEDRRSVLEGPDRYARDILQYMLAREALPAGGDAVARKEGGVPLAIS